MNFFERQRQVRRLSRRLVLLFALAVLGIVLAVNLAVLVGFGLFDHPPSTLLPVVAAVSAVTLLVIGVCSLVRTLLLRQGGGGTVAQQLGGVYVPEDTTDPALRRLRNVVEEMAIASGVSVPEVYVLEQEPGINAFAAGWSPADAAVAVTRGALQSLNRDELQGVIAHEFSHVVNGDMRLNIRLIGVLFGILALAVVGRFLLYGGRGRGKGAGAIVLVALALLAAGYIGVFFGRLIKAAVSRQREYLADASAVQFTRQTQGLVGALKKIGGLATGSTLRNGKVEDVSHMLFGDGLRLTSMFATHPPLPERIKVLDPAFDPQELAALSQHWASAPPDGLAEDHALGLMPTRERRTPSPASLRVRPDQVVASVAAPDDEAYREAARLLERIPEPYLARARRPDSVVPLVFALLLAADPAARTHQLGVLAARHGQRLAEAVADEAGDLARLDPRLRLPLAEVAFAALRRRPADQLHHLLGTVYELIRVDGRTSVFEYCLSRLLYQELEELTRHGRAHQAVTRHGHRGLAGSREAVTTLLSVLARVGQPDQVAAKAAFAAGAGPLLPGLRYAPPAQGVVALESVWPALDGLPEPDKAALVASLATVVSHDGVITVEEYELLRTVCALLHCPLPPLTDEPAS